MSRMMVAVLLTFGVFFELAAGAPQGFGAAKDQSRIGDGGDDLSPLNDPIDDDLLYQDEDTDEGLMLDPEDIPEIESVELDEHGARRALDAFAEVRHRYDGFGIENYPTLEAFVEQTDAGKRLEADIHGHGFASITEWNKMIMTVGFAYGAVVDQQEPEIRLQIKEVEADLSLDEEARRRMVTSLYALIPSPNNRRVIEVLMKDDDYAVKLQYLLEE